MGKMDFWRNILGFQPEKELDVDKVKSKCYKCDSENIKIKESPSWTSKYKCNDCNYFTFVVWTDRMGGGFSDSVAIDEKDSDM